VLRFLNFLLDFDDLAMNCIAHVTFSFLVEEGGGGAGGGGGALHLLPLLLLQNPKQNPLGNKYV